MLVGATAEKYSAIRDIQLENRRTQKELIKSKSIPVLPEWKDVPLPAPEKKPEAAAPEANDPTTAPAPAPVKGE